MVKPEEKTAEKPPLEQPSQCLLCGQVGPALFMGIGFVTTARTWSRRRPWRGSARLKRRAVVRRRRDGASLILFREVR
jgi:hypothetical protein